MAFYHRSKNWAASASKPYYPPAPAIPAELARIDALLNNPAFTGLKVGSQDFIKSIKLQAASKGLSAAQINYLTGIEKEIRPVDLSWYDTTNSENIAKRAYALVHYKAKGYYGAVIAKMDADPAFMPEQATWDRMWGNVFINAGWKRYSAGSKFSVGQIVNVSARTGLIQKIEWSCEKNHWTCNILEFESGRAFAGWKESDVHAIKEPKVKPVKIPKVKVPKVSKIKVEPAVKRPRGRPPKKKEV
jgi:hypothetical protein